MNVIDKVLVFIVAVVLTTLLFTAIALAETCRLAHPPSADWRRFGFLYKPEGEHTKLPTLIFARRKPERVSVRSAADTKRRRIPFWSSGSLGHIFREPRLTGQQYNQRFGRPFLVKVNYQSRCKAIVIKDGTKRSDGR